MQTTTSISSRSTRSCEAVVARAPGVVARPRRRTAVAVRTPSPAATPAARLSALAAARSGLFTRNQALACGFSAYQIRRRVRDGEWQRVLGSVLSTAGLRPTPQLRDAAAQMAVGGSVLAGPSAARRHGIVVHDSHCYLAAGPGERTRLPGVRLLRDALVPSDIVIVDGVPTTDRARTIFDCLRVLPDPDAVDLLDRALRAGWISAAEFAGRVQIFVGRRGAKRLARLSRLAGSGARSAAEGLGELLRRGGVTGWRADTEARDAQGPIGLGALVFEVARVVVEIDGCAQHTAPERFERDRERHNRLAAAGWVVVRFTQHDLTERPEYVIATVRSMLRLRACGPDSAANGPDQRLEGGGREAARLPAGNSWVDEHPQRRAPVGDGVDA